MKSALATLIIVGLGALLSTPGRAQSTFADPGFAAETVATLPPFSAVGLAFAPDGRLFVWQRDGVVRIVKDGSLLATPFLDIRAKVNAFGDRGLLGLALDPGFTTNGYVYLLYTLEGGGNSLDSGPKTARLSRVIADPANPDVAIPGVETVVLDDLPSDGPSHTVGTVRFRRDGTLFLSLGDGASYTVADPLALRAQDLDSYSGKILRIDPDGTAPGDNPFDDGTNSIRSKVWAYGLRNAYRFGLHPVTDEPYIGDVGWNQWEEINRGRGANFGWPCYEGNAVQSQYQPAFTACQELPPTAVTPPLYTYSHDGTGGSTVIGGAFYTGTQYPELYRGNFFFADYTFRWIRRMVFDADDNVGGVVTFATNIDGPVSLELGPDGLLYYVEFNSGRVRRILYNGPVARASATPTSGYSPLTVSFSSDGTLNPAGGPLTYAWDFGDGNASTTPDPAHTYVTAGVATFAARLTVTATGGLSSSATVDVTVGSQPPVAMIAAPADGTGVLVGDTVVYQGSATDADDGILPPGALSWIVLLHHNTHVHPLTAGTGSQGSFEVTYHGAGSFAYEVILTATDSSGLTDTESILLPFNPLDLPFVTGVAANPANVIGGTSMTGTVSLSVPAPAGGLTVSLSSSHAAVQVPPSVAVLAGSSTASFPVTTSPVVTSVSAVLTATLNGSVHATLNLIPPPAVIGLTFNPSFVVGGSTAAGTVTISVPAPSGGTVVALSSDNGAVSVPPSVTVPEGSTTASFSAATAPVASQIVATITASANGGTQATLTLINFGTATLSFTYPTRDDFLASGWDFLARTATGDRRDTEQAMGLMVSYDQVAHPGVMRIPADFGDLWALGNHSRNTIFRDLPAGWESIRLRIEAFAPTQPYQATCLLAYQDDDNYMALCRDFTGSQIVEWWHETGGTPVVLASVPNSVTGNLWLRVDRAPDTNTLTAFVSTDNGAVWTQLPGSVVKPLNNPRLGIMVGGNASSSAFPTADLAAVQIVTPAPPPDALVVSPLGLSFGAEVGGPSPAAQTLSVSSAGALMTWTVASSQPWLSVSPASGATPATLTVTATTAGLAAGIYNATIALTSPDASNSPQTVPVTLVLAGAGVQTHIDFAYATRDALLAGGWDFLARTAGGGTRDTEQISGLVVSYDQGLHPGTIRIPADTGTLWGAINTTRNTVFRTLPPDWESIRLKIATFAPTSPYQGACIAAYQDDDSYVILCRDYAGAQVAEWWHETGASATVLGSVSISATADVLLRLDRVQATNAITAFVSTDDGVTWTQLPGSIVKPLSNPRLGLVVGGNTSPTVFPPADLRFVEVITPTAAGPALGTSPSSLSFSGVPGGPNPASQSLSVTNTGSGSLTWMAASSQPWLSVSPTSGTVPDTFAVTAGIAGLTAGTYSATITLTSPEATNSPYTVPVTLTLASSAAFGISPASLSFTGAAGGPTPSAQSLSVTNTGGGSLTWAAATSQPWLSVDPIAGTAPATLGVTVSSAGLTAGTYNATISLTSSQASNSPQTVPVTLTLTSSPALGVSPSSLSFSATPGGANPAPQSLAVTNAGSGSLTWSAVSSQPWLSVSPTSGAAPATLTVTAATTGLAAGTYSVTITVTSPEASNSPRTVPVTVVVASSGLIVHHDLSLEGRDALLASGWDFIARTAGGGTRNTEQISGLLVSYDQTSHPGVIRIPADQGSLWAAMNDTRNTLFLDLPTAWESIRLKVAAFAPTFLYQASCLVAYEDDDNYVTICRDFIGAQVTEWWSETDGIPTVQGNVPVTATADVFLRLDRIPATNTLTAFVSPDNGVTWTQLPGSVVKPLASPRLGVLVGGNTSSSVFPPADVAFVEIVTSATPQAGLGLSPASLSFVATPGGPDPTAQSVSITNSGTGAMTWTATANQPWVTLTPSSGTAPAALQVTVSAGGLPAGTYGATITITSPEAGNSPQSVPVVLSVSSAHFDFTYSGRTALLAAGWDFLARTATGSTRNTEQTSGLVVDYNQTAHPGVVRIPVDRGSLWAASNDTRNTIFRNLPADWESIHLKIAAFSPSKNYHAACLAAYQDDSNYVTICRSFSNGQRIEWWHETSGSPATISFVSNTATGNILLRLDRAPSTQTITAFFSLNNGTSWSQLPGSIVKPLSNPRLGVVVGGHQGSNSGIVADIAFAEVVTPAPAPPTLSVTPASLAFSAVQGQPAPAAQYLTIANTGGAALNWTASADQPWVSVTPASGAAPNVLTIAVSPAGLAPGTYGATLTLSSLEAANSPRLVQVTLSVISLGPARNLTAAVLVNSANPAGYNPSPASPGEFQRYPERYLEHLQVPYEVIDVSATSPPPDLPERQLIIAGHRGLNPSAAWQNAIVAAVKLGSGFVNLDWDAGVGSQAHIQEIFGVTGSTVGAPGSAVTVPAAVVPGGAAPHYIAGLQQRFGGQTSGDLLYPFHTDQTGVLRSVRSTLLTGAAGTVIATVNADPLILATAFSAGRAVHVGTLEYLKADRFGFVHGVDDLFWRSLVWAARKPFAVRGYPRLWAVQMDDTLPGWTSRVKDLYNTSLTGVVGPDGTGGPWKVTGYLYTDHLQPGSADRASVISDITAGRLHVVPHAFGNVNLGDMYWNATAGQLTDDQWLTNLGLIESWRQGLGSADAIPSLSRSLVAHFWDLSNNTGADLWTVLGFRYVTSIQKPGFQRDENFQQYGGQERLAARPFWLYEQPPKRTLDENEPFFFADDYTVGSRGGLLPRTFFLFTTQMHHLGESRPELVWPASGTSGSVAETVDQFKEATWRFWSSLAPMQAFTHDASNYVLSSIADRQAVISQLSAWLGSHNVRHVFMEDLGDYIYARTKSVLTRADLEAGSITYAFTGTAATAEGTPVQTEVRLFLGDDDGTAVVINGFLAGSIVSRPVIEP
jgi:glucose/arabinose dehydrogenase